MAQSTGWDTALEARLRDKYARPETASTPALAPVATPAGDGFLAEIAGKLILTAPARQVSVAEDLPETMRDRWERASAANPYFLWLGGRFVEAERANRNGAFWATEDLQFGEMSVRNGPLNWLHQGRKVIGTVADNALIMPTGETAAAGRDRPYIAAVSAVWKWLYPDEAQAVQIASDAGQLYYSMECVARQIACISADGREGCGESFDYMQAMTKPDTVCQHIRERSSVRRMVEPAFLGGAVIVPPVRPGWGEANAEVMRQAAALAAQVAGPDESAREWELLMAAVVAAAY